MGAELSTQPAEDKAEQAQKTIDEVLKSFQDKRQLYFDELSRSRGENAQNKSIEVTGGRTISEYSQIFYTEQIGPNSEITGAINDFFKAADSGIDGNNDDAKHSAIQGAKSLIMAAIDGILGNTSIGVQEVSSFCVIFLNNSFVRLDYRFYQQNIDVVKYLAGVRSTARLIVCEIAVLPIQDMKPAEISYLLSQAFDLQVFSDPTEGFATLGNIQTSLIQLNVLTAMLQSVLKEEESEDDRGKNNVSSIENRSKALIQLSQSISEVLEDIRNRGNSNLRLSASNPGLETEIKDVYNDMDRHAKYVTSWFLKQIEEYNGASEERREAIVGKAKTVLKNTYLEYDEAFMDIYSYGEGGRGYTTWYNASKDKFALWWFDFLRKVEMKKEDKTAFFQTGLGLSKPEDFLKQLLAPAPESKAKALEGNDGAAGGGAAGGGAAGGGAAGGGAAGGGAAGGGAAGGGAVGGGAAGGANEADDENSAISILNEALTNINNGKYSYTLMTVSALKMKKALAKLEYPRPLLKNDVVSGGSKK